MDSKPINHSDIPMAEYEDTYEKVIELARRRGFCLALL